MSPIDFHSFPSPSVSRKTELSLPKMQGFRAFLMVLSIFFTLTPKNYLNVIKVQENLFLLLCLNGAESSADTMIIHLQ